MLAPKPELIHDARPIVAQQHIRLGRQFFDDRPTIGGL